MKTRFALILVIALAAFCFARYELAHEGKAVETVSEIKPQQFQAVAFGISSKVSDFAPASPDVGLSGKKSADEKARSVPNNLPFRKQIPNAAPDAPQNNLARFTDAPMPVPLLSFDGLSSTEVANAYGFRVVPPDTNGDVGPNHFVQTVNILTRVFDKTGAPLTPPFKLSSIFSVLGTSCSMRNDGDPIVLYDALADRWLISQFCSNAPPFRQLIAVSQTADPTGSYFVYEFVMPNVKFNDYPKLGVWSDGYYMSTDEFIGSDYAGSGVFAFDKRKMLAGDRNASFIYFDLASPSTIRFGGLLPSDFDGLNAPPANAPNVFVGYQATEYGDAADALRLFDFHADFTNPSRSTFTERAESPLTVAPFDPTSPEGRSDISEPPPGEPLDAQSDRLMYRAAYRNLGAQQSLVVNQTVRVSPAGQAYRGGVRVYELRKTGGGAFAVRENATIGTSDASRWIGSAAQDYQGNLAVGYSLSSEAKNPSILYTGRLAGEPAGMFRVEETLVSGTGVQTGFGSRWGDYSQLTVDPSDDCTFWLTNEYYTAESQTENPYGWLTRIGKFKFNECTNAPRSVITGRVTNAVNLQAIAGAIITANAVYTRTAGATGLYNFTLVPNTYVLTAQAFGYRSQSITVTVADGQNLIQSFALEPIAVFANPVIKIEAESCAANHAVDPSETVTIDVGLQNTGAAGAANLTATLLPSGGVTNPGAAQNYGAIPANGTIVSRAFTFTASPNLRCGDALTLTFQLTDGAENLGTISIVLNAGAPRTAFAETFDSVHEPDLPSGWTTSASGAQDVWKTSDDAFQSPPNAAYSYAAGQVGVNELTSPAFQINSETARLTFRNRYDLETTFLRNKLYDGAILEIKIGGGNNRFVDILAAGGAFESGGYDGVLDSCCQNPLSGRLAWSGKSGVNQTPEFVTTTVKLPASAAGKTVQLRWRVGTDNGTFREGQFIDDVKVSDGFTCACQTAQTNRAPFDFDSDGRTDLSVFRPSDSASEADFFVRASSNNSSINTAWGSVGDLAANADYDGDGRTDYAVFRPATRTWFVLRSSDNSIFPFVFGLADDRLAPADYDGDGRSDIAVWRASNGFWYVRQSSDASIRSVQFGANGDLPVQADYDGDGKTDFAVFRPSNGAWYIRRSSDGALRSVQFGVSGDKPVAGDFDGDGSADFVVFRPLSATWYLQKSTQGFSAVQFGLATDKLLQADFDGDGKRDIAAYRQSTGSWYYLKSAADGAFVAKQFGAGGDVPLPTIYIP